MTEGITVERIATVLPGFVQMTREFPQADTLRKITPGIPTF
jgi:hypothetical protein